MSSTSSPSDAETADESPKRPRGRPRTPKRVHVTFEPRDRLDIGRLALVLHGIYARDQAQANARRRNEGEAIPRDDAE